jgi:prophage regulatory protein
MTEPKRQESETDDGASYKSRSRRMLNEKQVLEIVPVGRTTLYRMEKAGRFPKGSYISPNRKIWFEDEVIKWQHEINGRGRGRLNHSGESKS